MLAFFSSFSLVLIPFCQNKNRSMPKFRFLTLCGSRGALTEGNVGKLLSGKTDLLHHSLKQRGKSGESITGQLLFLSADSFLDSGWPVPYPKRLFRPRRDYWSSDVCFSGRCHCQSLSGTPPCKVLLMNPSVFQLSINHRISQWHISLPTRSETKSDSIPFLLFCLFFAQTSFQKQILG